MIEGERKAIIAKQIKLTPDNSLSEISIQLPVPKENANWPQRGGIATHALKHVQLGDAPERVWQSKIGEGGSESIALTAAPIVANGIVMTLDTAGKVRAFALKTGELLWETILKPEENAGIFGGGLGSGQNKIFISLGSGELIALNIQNGEKTVHLADSIILCTGGHTKNWKRSSSRKKTLNTKKTNFSSCEENG